jgi:hypothetical protein
MFVMGPRLTLSVREYHRGVSMCLVCSTGYLRYDLHSSGSPQSARNLFAFISNFVVVFKYLCRWIVAGCTELKIPASSTKNQYRDQIHQESFSFDCSPHTFHSPPTWPAAPWAPPIRHLFLYSPSTIIFLLLFHRMNISVDSLSAAPSCLPTPPAKYFLRLLLHDTALLHLLSSHLH